MNITDLIYRLIPLLLFVIIMMNPLSKKLIKRWKDRQEQEKKSAISRVSEKTEPTAPVINSMSPPPSRKDDYPLAQLAGEENKPSPSVEKIEKLADLKKAVVWSEILSTPVGLRD